MITSAANAQIKRLAALQTKSRARRKEKVYIMEGVRMLGEVEPSELVKLYLSETAFEKNIAEGFIGSSTYEVVKDSVFKTISDTVTPQGVLGIVKQKEYFLEEMLSDKSGGYLILEEIQDPGNLGTMFRTAEAAGMSGVIMDGNTVDIYNPKVVRSTMGALLRVPFVVVQDLKDAVRTLKYKGVRVYAAHLDGELFYNEIHYGESGAFLIGNEGNGLRNETAANADCLVRIPMEGKVESLNAAVAASLLMYSFYCDKKN